MSTKKKPKTEEKITREPVVMPIRLGHKRRVVMAVEAMGLHSDKALSEIDRFIFRGTSIEDRTEDWEGVAKIRACLEDFYRDVMSIVYPMETEKDDE